MVTLMRFGGYDLIILGLVLGAVSTALFAHVGLLYSEEAAQTFLNGNPFQTRHEIIRRWENYFGIFWLVVGLLAGITGVVQTVGREQVGHIFASARHSWITSRFPVWLEILVLLAAGLVAWRVTTAMTDYLSRREYLSRMIDGQRMLFERDSFVLAHDGRYREEVDQGMAIEPEILQQRLADASRNFDQIGKLIDLPRLKGETDQQYVDRLRPFFDHDYSSSRH